jgi:hypothetical protein
VTADPPYVEVVLKGHKKGVTGDKILSYDRKALPLLVVFVMSSDIAGVQETKNSCIF